MRSRLTIAAVVAAAPLGLAAAALATGGNPGSPPGRDPCSHGATGKVCRPDPQPGHGKDCDHHGKQGGVNEDHCAGTTTTAPGTTTGTTSSSTTVQTVTKPGQTVTITTGPTPNAPKPLPAPGSRRKKKATATIVRHVRVVAHRAPKTTG